MVEEGSAGSPSSMGGEAHGRFSDACCYRDIIIGYQNEVGEGGTVWIPQMRISALFELYVAMDGLLVGI